MPENEVNSIIYLFSSNVCSKETVFKSTVVPCTKAGLI